VLVADIGLPNAYLFIVYLTMLRLYRAEILDNSKC
jgi:hypothetical protein